MGTKNYVKMGWQKVNSDINVNNAKALIEKMINDTNNDIWRC